MGKQYALHIGKWQSWDETCENRIKKSLSEGKKVWIAIQDAEKDEHNTRTAKEVFWSLVEEPFIKENYGKVFISVIPDICSINYGKDESYDIVNHGALT